MRRVHDFGRNFRYLIGLLDMQNQDTPGEELSQGFREAGHFKIVYSCAILRLLERRDFFAKSMKNDNFLQFLTPETKTGYSYKKTWVYATSYL